jgi:enamine deaminase RidA (YjgF/YER057c/UK114 family)
MERYQVPALRALVPAVLLMAILAAAPRVEPGVRLRSIGGHPSSGVARAVVVEEGALVHTALMYPENASGDLEGAGDAAVQARRALHSIELALSEARTTLDHLVRLHVYVADQSVTPQIDRFLAERFGSRQMKPAVTFVETAMPRAGLLVAMDAIAATAWTPEPGSARRLAAAGLPRRTTRATHVAIQPAGPFVIVSGRAAPGAFDAAIRETMAQLRGDLGSVGLTFDDVVQIKSFLGDLRAAGQLETAVAEFFGEAAVPPQVVTEWRQNAAPAEIELVAAARPDGGTRTRVEHFEPISGRYSRVARANGGQPVFVSGLHGVSADPAAQVGEMFGELQRVLEEAGSDIRHLVKATYYVSDPAADERINTIRPTIYDPQHPPAASKLFVRGTGRSGKASTFDMIAVTAAR